MKVALVCPYDLDVPGGVGTHVLGLARWLSRQGHQVRVVAPGTQPPESSHALDVELVGRTVGLPFNGSVARLALAPSQARRAVAATRGSDLVHVHEPLTPGMAYEVARRSRPLVVTHHANFGVPKPLGAILRRRAGALPDRLSIAVSDAAAATCVAATGVPAVVIPNAIESPTVQRRTRTGVPRVGFLGRVDERRKGFKVFRRVAHLALQRGMRAAFVAAGPGRAPGGPVERLGAVRDRWQFLASLDVLVAPNLSGESFGMVIVEALAAGCDVVASDLPAFQTLLTTAGVGALAPTGDAEGFLEVLQQRLDQRLDPAAAAAAARQWSWESVGPPVLALYLIASPMA